MDPHEDTHIDYPFKSRPEQLDRFTVANPARIPCTIRTLKPYWTIGTRKPWVHSGELMDALLYLAARSGLQDEEVRALKELLEEVSSLLNSRSDLQALRQDGTVNTEEQLTQTTPAGSS